MRHWKSSLSFILAAICIIVVFTTLQDGLPSRAWCSIVAPFIDPRLGRQRFFSCSNIEQSIVKMVNVTDMEGEVASWRVFTPTDPAKPATIHLKVKIDRPNVVLYPRFSGPDDAVTIHEIRDERRRLLFFAQGTPGQWSPISEQYQLSLRCVDFGWRDEIFDAELVITLHGRFAQLWHHEHMILY